MAVKPLSAKDLKSYHEGMYEIDFILGETKIVYYPLVSKSNSIYNENKRVQYGEPIHLTGQVTFPSDATEHTFTDSSKKDIKVQVSIPYLALERYTYVNTENQPEELPRLDPNDIVKGYFILDNKKYVIDDYLPTGLFASTYTSYTFLCKGVDVI